MRTFVSLRRRSEFARVHKRGRRRASAFLTALTVEGARRTRVGITVSTAVGGAVARNRLRRQIKSILDRYALGGPPFRDIVLIARPGAAELSYDELRAEVERTFGAPA